MAISNIGASAELSGLSTDEKPTNVPVNTLFLELDTGLIFYFTGETWETVGSGGAE